MDDLSVQTDESPLIGKAAPDAVLVKSDGTSASVIGEQQGEKAILFFWATWCPHCYEEVGTINDNFASIEQKGIKNLLWQFPHITCYSTRHLLHFSPKRINS